METQVFSLVKFAQILKLLSIPLNEQDIAHHLRPVIVHLLAKSPCQERYHLDV